MINLEKRLEMYRLDYFFHIDFKEKIYARMVLFSVFITACITANFSMQDVLIKIGCIRLIVMIIWIFSAVILIFVIFKCISITSLKSDEWVNSNAEMESYRDILRQHFINHTHLPPNEERINKYVNEQFTIYLIDQYSRCSTILNENNIYRQKCLSHLAISTYLLLILTFTVSLFFIYQKFEGDPNVAKPTNTATTTATANKGNQR